MLQPPCDLPIPAWLSDFAIDDAEVGRAYEDTPPAYRAILKTGLALAHHHYNSAARSECRSWTDIHSGFHWRAKSRPADVALLYMEEPAPARICAAAALPLFAGVRTVLAALPGPHPAMLAALELCAIADIFVMDIKTFVKLAAEMAASASCRIFFMGQAEKADCLRSELAIPAFFAVRPPQLRMEKENREREALAQWLHNAKPFAGGEAFAYCDALFADGIDGREAWPGARLILGPGCDGFWLFENLEPGFYMRTSLACGMG